MKTSEEEKTAVKAEETTKKKKRIDYKGKAAQLEEELAAQKDKYLRLAADMDNVRKNALKERQSYMKYKNESIARDLIPVVDDFERCLTHIPEDTADEELKALGEGVNLIYDKLMKALSKNSVVKMDVKPGADFDVNKHEAVSIVPAGADNAGKVVAVTDCGYMLADKVVRYAKVVVGKKDED